MRPKITEIDGHHGHDAGGCKETAETAIPKLMEFIGDAAIRGAQRRISMACLAEGGAATGWGIEFHAPVLDTLAFSRKLLPWTSRAHKLRRGLQGAGREPQKRTPRRA